jgi:hypothetical protein
MADPKNKTVKLTLSQVAEQEVKKIVGIDGAKTRGIYTLEQNAKLIQKRIEGDLTLLGFDISSTANQVAGAFAESRRPDFHKIETRRKKDQQTAFQFYWYQEDRIIPVDEKGTQVFLGWATMEHWEAYAAIRNKKLMQFEASESGFKQADAYIRANMDGHLHLRDLIKEKGL